MRADKKQFEEDMRRCLAERIAITDIVLEYTKKEVDSLQYKTIVVPRQQIYDELWSIGMSKLCDKYDSPYTKMKQSVTDAEIPIPTVSYWGSLQMGTVDKAVKAPLPDSEKDSVTIYVRDKSAVSVSVNKKAAAKEIASQTDEQNIEKEQETEIPDGVLDFLDEPERRGIIAASNQIMIQENAPLHRVLKQHKAAAEKCFKNEYYDRYASRKHDSWWKRPAYMPFLCDSIDIDSFPRVYKLLNTLFRCLESLGGKVNDDLTVTIRGEKVSYKISEGQKETSHAMSEKEKKEYAQYEADVKIKGYGYKPKIRKYDYISTGRLTFSISEKRYRDTDITPIEARLGEILIRLFEKSENIKQMRLAAEEAERKKQKLQIVSKSDEKDMISKLTS